MQETLRSAGEQAAGLLPADVRGIAGDALCAAAAERYSLSHHLTNGASTAGAGGSGGAGGAVSNGAARHSVEHGNGVGEGGQVTAAVQPRHLQAALARVRARTATEVRRVTWTGRSYCFSQQVWYGGPRTVARRDLQ